MDTTVRYTDSDDLRSGVELQGGRYRIVSTLGRGGFGITYLAEQVNVRRKVCIKEFFPKAYYRRDGDSGAITLSSDGFAELMSKFKTKFIKEAYTIAELDHPNIIRIHDVFEENSTAYYVMEYIDGESLQSKVKSSGAMAEAVAREYIKQVAAALDHVHSQQIMHLDVKPGNVMVRAKDNRAILIDFGLAKHYDTASGDATSTTPVGVSHGYAPMEQYKDGGVSSFSPSTDIYSLGATLYFLVVGKTPPSADLVGEDGIGALPSGLSRGTRSAIERAMQHRRKDRPQSIADFLALLGGKGKPVAPVPSTHKKRSNWWLWLLLLLLIAVGGVVGYMMLGDEPEPTPEPTPSSSTGGEKVDNADSLRARERQDSLRKFEELEQRRLDSLRHVDRERFVRDSIRERRRLDSLNRVDAASLRLNSSSVDVGYDGGSNSVSYRLENSLDYLKVECTTNKSWITDIKSSNNKISFTVKANGEYKSRSGIITVDYGTKSYSITVTQAARPAPTFTLAKSSLTVDSSGGSHSVGYTIEHPIDGASVSVSDNKSWITNPSASGGKITFKTTDHTSTESRTGTITATYNGITRQITVTQKGAERITSTASSPINIGSHTAVDLGLSVKWATCNVGATSPEGYGDYFAWGETSPKTSYTKDNCKTWDKRMGDMGGDSSYDAATANWGSGWRLPTESEFRELIDNCTWTWTKLNGVDGCEVKSKKNGNSIFLPAAGCCYSDTTDYQGSYGDYWSSAPGGAYGAYCLYFGSDSHYTSLDRRYLGRSVRPVAE